MEHDPPSQAKEAFAVVQNVRGEKVVAAYLFGSAVVGGLRPDSDVDVLVVVDGQLSRGERKGLEEQLMAVSGKLKLTDARAVRPLEVTVVSLADVVPWRYPPRRQFQYGEWLRERFEEDRIPGPEFDPDLAIVLTQVRGESIPIHGPPAPELLDEVPWRDLRSAMVDSLPALIAGLRGDERNVLLTLCRMCMTRETGRIVPKDVAAEWVLERLPAEQGRLVDLARAGYRGEREDDWVGLEDELEELVAVLRRPIETPSAEREGGWSSPVQRLSFRPFCR